MILFKYWPQLESICFIHFDRNKIDRKASKKYKNTIQPEIVAMILIQNHSKLSIFFRVASFYFLRESKCVYEKMTNSRYIIFPKIILFQKLHYFETIPLILQLGSCIFMISMSKNRKIVNIIFLVDQDQEPVLFYWSKSAVIS